MQSNLDQLDKAWDPSGYLDNWSLLEWVLKAVAVWNLKKKKRSTVRYNTGTHPPSNLDFQKTTAVWTLTSNTCLERNLSTSHTEKYHADIL